MLAFTAQVVELRKEIDCAVELLTITPHFNISLSAVQLRTIPGLESARPARGGDQQAYATRLSCSFEAFLNICQDFI